MRRILFIGLAAVVGGLALFLVIVLFGPGARKADAPPRAAATAPVTAPESRPAAPATSPVAPAAPAPRATRRTPAAAAPAPVEPSAPVAAAPDTGTLRITSDVPGAQVFLDRQFIGAAPVTAEHVKPGMHQLNVSAEGFDGIAQTVDVMPGPRDVMIRFREVRLDARLSVVHKHRLGSCSGQLIATPQGLRYETTNTDDAFNVPLTDLEVFQVDYLNKNLRVKVRNGRQYNFTDPDGNADRLFVFQRDVDKARQRLATGQAAGPSS